MTDLHPAGIPADTSIEAWKLEIAALRRMTQEQRSRMFIEFQTAIERTQRDAVRRKYPDLDDRTVSAILVKRRHGAVLAEAAYPDLDISNLR